MLERLTDKLSGIARSLSGKNKISEKNIQDAVSEIKVALLEADVNVRVVRRFVNRTIEEATGDSVLKAVSPGQQFVKLVYDKLIQFLGDEQSKIELKGPDTTSVILMTGLQGSGKTTTAAKLARRLKNEGRRPLLVAADLVRPAAVDQLHVLGERAGIEVFSIADSRGPVDVTSAALKHASKQQFDTVIVDTAGRLQIDEDLMDELSRVRDACDPVATLLVADAMTGQNAVDIAKAFDQQIGLTGVILSKFDSDARGGAALSIKTITGKPIVYVGVGEKIEDLEPFYPDRTASRILGMGDVVSLVEKAQDTYDRVEAESLQRKMQTATFTLEDYLDQFRKMRKMGSLQSLIEMIPGAAGSVSQDDIDQDEIKYEEAMILSMTVQERRNHHIIGPSRRKRIAKGSGTSTFQVNRLLKKFEKMRNMMKKVTKNKKYQKQMFAQLSGR